MHLKFSVPETLELYAFMRFHPVFVFNSHTLQPFLVGDVDGLLQKLAYIEAINPFGPTLRQLAAEPPNPSGVPGLGCGH